MAELAAARAEVEAAAVADAACAAVAELKLVREAAREQVAQWAAAHPRGARGGCAPDGGGSPDRRGRAGGWIDGDRGLYRWRGSPSPDRYHGHHGIQAIVRDVGPGGGWPTLPKTNYVEWAAVMRVRHRCDTCGK
jgi:hypothetical protein